MLENLLLVQEAVAVSDLPVPGLLSVMLETLLEEIIYLALVGMPTVLVETLYKLVEVVLSEMLEELLLLEEQEMVKVVVTMLVLVATEQVLEDRHYLLEVAVHLATEAPQLPSEV